MTRSWLPTEFRTGLPADRVGRFVLLARASLSFERVWPLLWPSSGIAGIFLALALFDIFVALPWTIHALVLSGCVTSIGLCLYQAFLGTRLPGWNEAARKLEHDSALAHRPISEASDRLSAGAGDETAEALWQLHMARSLHQPKGLRLALPRMRSLWRKRDPYFLRFAVLLLLMVGVGIAGGDSLRRISYAFGGAQGAGGGATLDAWIDPPPYTGHPPIYLTEDMGTIAVPEGSRLNLRVHNANRAPGATMTGREPPRFSGEGGEYMAGGTIMRDGKIAVRANGATIGHWNIKLVPDAVPEIAFTSKPKATALKAVHFSYRAKDDYGVTAVRALIAPKGKNSKPLIVDLTVGTGKDVAESAFRDLTAHPYAGLNVTITLEAQDAAGHKVQSKPEEFKLPSRVFTNPIARSLIEERQRLATDGFGARERVARTLNALTLAPDKFYADQFGLYLALRTAFWGIAKAAYEEDLVRVQDLLWQTATALELGGLANMAEELRRLQQMIAQALMQGAPQEVIDALLERYRTAMQRYLQAMAENGQNTGNAPLPPGTKMLGTEDLDALLKAIQKMVEAGAREEAQAMMAMLQSLLENLRMSQGSGEGSGQTSPREQALGDAVRGLGELMGKERALLDKTFREGQGGGKALAEEQKKLRDELNGIMGGLGEQKIPAPDELNKAGRAMGDAQGKLGQDNMEGASNAQKETLDNLRKSAEALAKMMQKNGSASGTEDPLGRAQGARGQGAGGVKIPDMTDIERARDILQELRKRAGERGRPQEELDYIDRLLKQF